MIWYGAGRHLIEGKRTDSLMLGNMKVAQIVSIAMFLVGLFIFIYKFRKSRLQELYNT